MTKTHIGLTLLAAVLAGAAPPPPVRAADPLLEKIDLFKAGTEGYTLYRIPGIVVTAKGTVLAYCEARKGGGDWSNIDILMRRSSDGGKTWDDPKKVVHVDGPLSKNPVSLPLKGVKPDDVTYNNAVAIADRDGTVHFLFCLEYMRCFYRRSDDDGRTWSAPVEITATLDKFRPEYNWKVLATGPGHGIQLTSGRLVVPVWLSTATGGNAHRPSVTATIYSDDRGRTWHRGDIAVPDTSEWVYPNETVAVQLADGRVLLNVRSESKAHRRIVTTSRDGATGWSRPKFHDQLLEPICMASTVRYSEAATGGKNRVLFANPHNLERADGKSGPGVFRDRQNLTIKLSYDECATWPVSKALEPGVSGYSDLAVLPDGTALCFYERGSTDAKSTTRTALLTVARFNLEWLTGGKDQPGAVAPAPRVRSADVVPPGQQYDLVVVGATPGGVACAVRAAREGLRVLLVDHSQHLGGILSNGLGVWDTLHEGKRSPIYDELRQAIFDHYRSTYGERSRPYAEALPGKTGHTNGKFEPRVAERLIDELVAREPRVTVLKGLYAAATERDGASLRSVELKAMDGARTVRVSARTFADCTYEGDLAAAARVPYRVGREARAEFNEPHAGKVFLKPLRTPPPDDLKALRLRLFGGGQALAPESTGAADGNVQACNFRTILTSDPANRVIPGKPDGYDREAVRQLEHTSLIRPIPNDKIGWNRPQLVPLQTAYVEGDWATRRRVAAAHKAATLGLLYYLQTDPAVPEATRNEFARYGLAKDEFTDNGHFPRELYVREARRIVGRAIVTEHDVRTADGLGRAPVHADSMAFTDWYMDSHACTKEHVPGCLDEGKMMLHYETRPGQIPYRALLPRGVDNLLVPVCLSATHVAWGAVRLEPTWMETGEAAGFAAALAKAGGVAVANLDSDRLVRTLADRGLVLTYFSDGGIGSGKSWVPAVQYFGTKGFFPAYQAEPDRPLAAALAREWARMFGLLAAGRLDPLTEARALHQLPRAKEEPVTVAEFARLLARQRGGAKAPDQIVEATTKRIGLKPDAGITRAQACELMYLTRN
jgi:sialidase-1